MHQLLVAQWSFSERLHVNSRAVLAMIGWDSALNAVIVSYRGTVLPQQYAPRGTFCHQNHPIFLSFLLCVSIR
jgi:hypothetical protein